MFKRFSNAFPKEIFGPRWLINPYLGMTCGTIVLSASLYRSVEELKHGGDVIECTVLTFGYSTAGLIIGSIVPITMIAGTLLSIDLYNRHKNKIFPPRPATPRSQSKD